MANKKKAAPKKISAYRRKQINLLISEKARLRSINKKIDKLKNDSTRTVTQKRAEMNELLNGAVKVNTRIVEVQRKTGSKKKNKFRDVKKDPKKLNIVLGKVWEKKDVEQFIFESGNVNSINGKEIGDDDDEILDLLNEAYQQMGSSDYIQLSINKQGAARLSIVNAADVKDDENDIDDEI